MFFIRATPLYLIVCFKSFGHALTFCHLLYKRKILTKSFWLTTKAEGRQLPYEVSPFCTPYYLFTFYYLSCSLNKQAKVEKSMYFHFDFRKVVNEFFKALCCALGIVS